MNKLNYQDPAGGGEGGGLSRFQVTGIKFSIPGFFWTVLLWVAWFDRDFLGFQNNLVFDVKTNIQFLIF